MITRGKSQTFAFLFVATALAASMAAAGPREDAIAIFDRVAGVPISLDDPRLARMESLVRAGDRVGAAAVATEDPSFYSVTLKHWASPMVNRRESPIIELNDASATLIGYVRDELDARGLLNGNIFYKARSDYNRYSSYDPTAYSASGVYQGDKSYNAGAWDLQAPWNILRGNRHYRYLEYDRKDLSTTLVPEVQKISAYYTDDLYQTVPADNPDPAGLMTTRFYGEEHMYMGTNRRPVEFAMRSFLCLPISVWRDGNVPDNFVRRDVTRTPGGSSSTYQKSCVRCHASLDSLANAFAYWDFVFTGYDFVNRFNYKSGANANFVKDRVTVQSTNIAYPSGYVPQDDSWSIQPTAGQDSLIGWKGPFRGRGAHDFGTLLASSEAFPRCMATRVFREICRREPDSVESGLIQKFADDFKSEKSGGNAYNLKHLFQRVAAHPACVQGVE